MLLALSLYNRWNIEQSDIVAAYLNSSLHHEVYIKGPKVTGTKVWKLKKALYGLKQSAHEWNMELTSVLKSGSMIALDSDPACYRNDENGQFNIFIATHIDDLLVVASSQNRIDSLISNLEQSLEVDRKGQPAKFLGIKCEVSWDNWTIDLRQTAMIRTLAEKYNIEYGARSPIASGADLYEPLPNEELINPSKC
jgi:hypothetical protein